MINTADTFTWNMESNKLINLFTELISLKKISSPTVYPSSWRMRLAKSTVQHSWQGPGSQTPSTVDRLVISQHEIRYIKTSKSFPISQTRSSGERGHFHCTSAAFTGYITLYTTQDRHITLFRFYLYTYTENWGCASFLRSLF